MKIKRLTKENRNGTISFVKKEIDFDMFSPVIAKVIMESAEQLAVLERKVECDELVEIPYPIGSEMDLSLNGNILRIVVTGYVISRKEMIIIFDAGGIHMEMNLKEALVRLKSVKRNGSVNAA